MIRDDAVNRSLYPFRSRYLQLGRGRMHHVDEGTGPVLVMVHGTPTWSFLYRDLIRELSRDHRVIAMDHLGFGLSDRAECEGYRPEEHAEHLALLIERLGLEEIILMVHDFGGPIGLSYALSRPERVRGIVLFNTWMWSIRGTPAERLSRLLGGPIGRFLYSWLNVSPRVLVKGAFGDRGKLLPEVHRHYIEAFPTRRDRLAAWVLARELIGSSEWYDALWQRRGTIVDRPALVLWGMKDPAFRKDALDRWRSELRAARIVEFPEAGHFVQEEAPEAATREIREFVAGLASSHPPSPSVSGLPNSPDGVRITRS